MHISDLLIMSDLLTLTCQVNKPSSETGHMQCLSEVSLTQVALCFVYSAKILLYLKCLQW